MLAQPAAIIPPGLPVKFPPWWSEDPATQFGRAAWKSLKAGPVTSGFSPECSGPMWLKCTVVDDRWVNIGNSANWG
jgi:hypothetical protein